MLLILEVRQPGRFEETLPGAINIRLDQLEGHRRDIPKDTQFVFT